MEFLKIQHSGKRIALPVWKYILLCIILKEKTGAYFQMKLWDVHNISTPKNMDYIKDIFIQPGPLKNFNDYALF